jgi:hypothetical protein
VSVQLHLFGGHTASPGAFAATGFDYIRNTRRLLTKLEDGTDLELVRSQRILKLEAAAFNRYTELSADPTIGQLWLRMSPGHARPADGGVTEAERTEQRTRELDAMRQARPAMTGAVAAAVARVLARDVQGVARTPSPAAEEGVARTPSPAAEEMTD